MQTEWRREVNQSRAGKCSHDHHFPCDCRYKNLSHSTGKALAKGISSGAVQGLPQSSLPEPELRARMEQGEAARAAPASPGQVTKPPTALPVSAETSLNSKPISDKKVRAPEYNTFKMYLHLFLVLFSSGASSYFLPPKETPHLQNKTQYTIIHEIICLLKAENDPIKVKFSKPLLITSQGCAHYNTEKFIHELKKISAYKCMETVEKDMKKLEQNCSILKKSSSKDENCPVMSNINFSRFKESLEEFLKWVNQKQECNMIMRSESGLYPDKKCTCSDLGNTAKACSRGELPGQRGGWVRRGTRNGC
ncbi:uncharacterized protein LOC141929171 [Strix aluco]|uniref:uncharacterized protein LOC141929171 n=1 Tax=Strix aluco TaxID=111821 RepID=UPI003DA1F247